MSGWDPYEAARIVFVAFLGLIGLLNLLRPYRDPASPRWLGLIFLALAALNLTRADSLPRQPIFLILFGAMALAAGLWLLVAGAGFQARRVARYEAKRAAGETVPANAPVIAPPAWRLLNTAVLLLFGGAFLALGLSVARS